MLKRKVKTLFIYDITYVVDGQNLIAHRVLALTLKHPYSGPVFQNFSGFELPLWRFSRPGFYLTL